jgi:mRNA interferase HigB
VPINVLARKTLLAFATGHPDALEPLLNWEKHARKADWANFADVRADFGSVDWVKGYLVFTIGGNKYRLITVANFQGKRIFVKHILTHKQYDAWETE